MKIIKATDTMHELITFRAEVMGMIGYTLQINAALALWDKWLRHELQRGAVKPTSTMYFGHEPLDPKEKESSYQYERTFNELMVDVRRGLPVHLHSMIVLLVASWEEEYRERIATECGLAKKGDLTRDVFRDLNRYRQAIVHAKFVLPANPKVLPFFNKGDVVRLNNDHMDGIFRHVIEDLNRIGKEHYRKDPQFRLDTPFTEPIPNGTLRHITRRQR